ETSRDSVAQDRRIITEQRPHPTANPKQPGGPDQQRLKPASTACSPPPSPQIALDSPLASHVARNPMRPKQLKREAAVEDSSSMQSHSQRERTPKPDAVQKPRTSIAPSGLKPMPVRQSVPAAPSLPSASSTNESRISIGRIEVQVNNHLPAA